MRKGHLQSAAERSYHDALAGALQLDAMALAAKSLVGRHDFRHYTLAKTSVVDFVREIYSLQIYSPPQTKEVFFPWQELAEPLVIEVTGNGFLYKMVRIIVGRLVAIGKGELPPEALAQFLSGQRQDNIPPAPARGLFLDHIWYQ